MTAIHNRLVLFSMDKTFNFCTLFDSNYLDKGLVLYDSLERNVSDFCLYVLAMDNVCFDILSKINHQKMVVINISEFCKYEQLTKIYKERKHDEFCYTCTPHLIDYVINFYNLDMTTYIDSDMYFYSNPLRLFDNFENYDVQIIKHGFGNTLIDKKSEIDAGKFCIEFNTFKKGEKSLQLLDWWKNKCRESCSANGELKEIHGDQKYLNEWDKFQNVEIISDIGAGLAPWNVFNYKLINKNDDNIMVKRGKEKTNIIFYHFHNISYLDENTVSISVYNRHLFVDDKLIECIYLPYLDKIQEKKNFLFEYFGIYPIIKKHPTLTKNTNNTRRSLFSRLCMILKNKSFIDVMILVQILFIKKINKGKNIIKLGNRN